MATFFGLFVKNRAKTTMIITKTPAVILSKSARSLIHGVCRRNGQTRFSSSS